MSFAIFKIVNMYLIISILESFSFPEIIWTFNCESDWESTSSIKGVIIEISFDLIPEFNLYEEFRLV